MIDITNECKVTLLKLIKQKKPNETGGILVGTRKSNSYSILYVVDSGPKSVELPYQFRKDFKYTQAELERLRIESNGKWGYLGEWHSHPGGNLYPSFTDTISMETVAKSLLNTGLKPLLLIGDVKTDQMEINIYVADAFEKRFKLNRVDTGQFGWSNIELI